MTTIHRTARPEQAAGRKGIGDASHRPERHGDARHGYGTHFVDLYVEHYTEHCTEKPVRDRNRERAESAC